MCVGVKKPVENELQVFVVVVVVVVVVVLQ
jgi:hypothetical protein